MVCPRQQLGFPVATSSKGKINPIQGETGSGKGGGSKTQGQRKNKQNKGGRDQKENNGGGEGAETKRKTMGGGGSARLANYRVPYQKCKKKSK